MRLSDFLKNSVRQIQYYPCLRPILGSVTAVIFFGQALYWSDKNDGGGWFWKTAEDWEKETGLTPDEQASARKNLKKIGVLKEDFRGLPRKLWFSLDLDRFEELVEAKFANDINIVPKCRFIASGNVGLLHPNMQDYVCPDSTMISDSYKGTKKHRLHTLDYIHKNTTTENKFNSIYDRNLRAARQFCEEE